MFKKVKYSDGKREFYLFGKKIFQYVNCHKFVEFVANKFDNITTSLLHNTPLDIAKITYDINRGGGTFMLLNSYSTEPMSLTNTTKFSMSFI